MSKDIEQTLKWKVEECQKVIKSFTYFLNNYVWIEDKASHTAIKLELWPEQEKIISTIVESPLLIILKARQLGLTWLIAAYVLWQTLRNRLYLTVVISVNEELSIEFLERVYFIMDRCPKWLGTAGAPIKTRSKQVLEIQHLRGLVGTIKSLPTTEMGAQSKTPNLLIMDETCKNRMSRAIFNASYPGIEAAKGQVILISNAIKEGAGWYFTRDLYIATMRGLNKFRRIFLSWAAHPGRPADFKEQMLLAGMSKRDIDENYPDTEEEAIEDRNIKGVYYSRQMTEARKDKRISSVPYVEGHEVNTFWDLGIDDANTIWFMQQIGREYRFIDYYENYGMGFSHYAKVLKEKPYVYGDHYMPHDVEKREMGGDTDVALSRKEVAENLGIRPILTVKRAKDSQAILNGIEAVRNILGQCCFDEEKCAKGILGLEAYQSEWDEEKEKLGNKPLHNWASHPADGFRTFAVGYTQETPKETTRNMRDYFNSDNAYMGG